MGSREGRRRVDLQTAAELLGISSDAVRKRAKRGKMSYEIGADGKLYVWVDDGETTDYPSGESPVGGQGNRDELLEEMRGQIAFLRRELEARTEEARRKDHIIMQMAQRVPELEAPRDEPRETQSAAATPEGLGAERARREQTERERDELRSLLEDRAKPPETPRAPETASEEPAGTSGGASGGERETESSRRSSWWRRWFGGG